MHNVAQAECCFEERSEFVIFVTPGDVPAPHETFNDVSMQRLLRCLRRAGAAPAALVRCARGPGNH